MIRRLTLKHWRAFESLDIEFEEGTTFVVAPNGVGKTSLLLGLTWAVFGEDSDIDPQEHIRLGHDTAEAVVTIHSNEGEIGVQRTVRAGGRHKNEYRIDGRKVEGEVAEAALRDLYGAPPNIAAKLAAIGSAGSDPLDVEDHLFNAFGVSGLQEAAAIADTLHKEVVKVRRALRTESRQALSNREQLEADADRLRDEIESRSATRNDLTSRIQNAKAELQLVAAWTAYQDTLERRDDEIRRLIEANADVASDLDALRAHVSDQMMSLREAEDQATLALDNARAQGLAASSALDLLEGHHPACPTCARPFASDELDAALEAQRQSVGAANEMVESSMRQLAEVTSLLEELQSIQVEIERLTDAPTPPAEPVPEGDPQLTIRELENGLREHDENTGTLTSQLRDAEEALADDEAVREAHGRELTAWRREAMTQAAALSFRSSAERIANEQIAPLSDQVRWRWKALFGDDGLQLRADGSIVRLVGDRELPWEQLSGGERIWARLVAGLLILQASTTLPFAWIDEPLEHLDPRARRVVAADLARAPEHGGPRQIIVTTYEHAIVRQITSDVPGTALLVVNNAE